MGKKKKKKSQKKKKTDDTLPETAGLQGLSLLDGLSSAKKTETTLQTLLKGVSEQGFVHPKKEEEEKITPHLSHELGTKIAEDYLKEDILLTRRDHEKKKPRTRLVPKEKEKPKPEPSKKRQQKVQAKSKPDSAPPQLEKPKVPPLSRKPLEEVKLPEVVIPEEKKPTDEKEIVPTPVEEAPSSVKRENIYMKLTEFFEGLLKSYSGRYDRWENSISAILAILRKMRKITKKNTEDLVISINNIFEKIQTDLAQFKIKRTEIERVAEVDIEWMSAEFKRVLGLLELQVKEYQLKRVTDNYIREIRYYIS